MADYAPLLRDHVTLTCRSIDRIFLQAYVPKLQSVGGVCQFLYWQTSDSANCQAAAGSGDAAQGCPKALIGSKVWRVCRQW